MTTVLRFAFSLAAKLERAAINDRIAAARERLEAQGEAWGRLPSLDGLTRRAIIEHRAAGESLRSIAIALKVPKSTVARVSRNPPPAGGPDPAVVSA